MTAPNVRPRAASNLGIAADLSEAALEHARRGWPVFPCKPQDKKPLTKSGFKDATTNANVISGWWSRWPDAMIGVPTGPSFEHVQIP